MTDRPHVLFVDDEPRILSGLRRMLRPHRTQWEMTFADGAPAALDVLNSERCDVIVTDYRMPGMDGGQLLEYVRTHFPQIARVMLSGQTNEDDLHKIMLLTHAFISKPSTPEQIIATVDRLIAVGATTGDTQTYPPVSVGESLPSPPQTLLDLTAALNDPDASAQSVSEVIARDPAATAKILHLVNSSVYSTGRKVGNVAQATALLGLHTVRGLILVHDLVRTFDLPASIPTAWIDTLTLHAVESSRLARLLAADTEGENDAFVGGLLHEVGQLVLASNQPEIYGRILAHRRDIADQPATSTDHDADNTALDETESAAFGTDHRQIGARLLGLWGLPADVITSASTHGKTTADVVDGPASAVALAHLIVEADCGPVCGRCGEADRVNEQQLDPAALAAVTQWRRQRPRS